MAEHIPESLGIIAGKGAFPRLLAESARAQGVDRLFALAFKGETDPVIERLADGYDTELGERAAPIVDHLYLIGDEAAAVAAGARAAGLDGARITIVADRQELAARVVGALAPGDVVLVKASRALELEHVVNAIQSAAGEEAS